MIKFKIEKVGNMIFASNNDQVWKAWEQEEFTTRKLNNFKSSIQKNYSQEITWEIEI